MKQTAVGPPHLLARLWPRSLSLPLDGPYCLPCVTRAHFPHFSSFRYTRTPPRRKEYFRAISIAIAQF